jgi:hypothetical protein
METVTGRIQEFNPQDHMWRFVSSEFVTYDNFTLVFQTVDEPLYYAVIRGRTDDVCSYEISATRLTYDEIADYGSVEFLQG